MRAMDVKLLLEVTQLAHGQAWIGTKVMLYYYYLPAIYRTASLLLRDWGKSAWRVTL
jgi:hypothetical protein